MLWRNEKGSLERTKNPSRLPPGQRLRRFTESRRPGASSPPCWQVCCYSRGIRGRPVFARPRHCTCTCCYHDYHRQHHGRDNRVAGAPTRRRAGSGGRGGSASRHGANRNTRRSRIRVHLRQRRVHPDRRPRGGRLPVGYCATVRWHTARWHGNRYRSGN